MADAIIESIFRALKVKKPWEDDYDLWLEAEQQYEDYENDLKTNPWG